ncbi:DUF302 domain-containing protein [Halorussus salilacus]|uniref:DUF302 domain-containing protein n=1 Tax=Halorussus salilacus TaxID=2953750 RepID=UPI00209D6560|nr:DUF302 domain-containing protein [Halorussus salilacus]USZ67298.1 DUF302 domain-containing protein [Halorussus salilacus]
MSDTNRRAFLRATGLAGGLAFAGVAAGQDETTTASEETTTDEGDDAGLVTVESDGDFEATVERIRSDIEDSADMTLVTTVDHAENAESAGTDLPPTTLFLFGNPQIGTQLMQQSQTTGMDLPQKMLVWEDGDAVNVTYNDPTWVAGRHGIDAPGMVAEQVASVLRSLATGAE